jgi:hypothetical protein
MDLKQISGEINEILEERRKKLSLTFTEEDHVYHMKDKKGKVRTDFPSVSTVMKCFYRPFDTEAQSLKTAKGDLVEQERLIKEWKDAGDYSTNMGSRVHYELELDLIRRNGGFKTVREPIFECGTGQIATGDKMVIAGKKFLDLMEERGAILLDTEPVLGDPELGYTGAPDKTWLMMNRDKSNFGLVITDWKTNQPKNFVPQWYTKWMLPPFTQYRDTSLEHYYTQLPLYGKLLLKMLQGSKYADLKLLGSVIVLLKEDSTYVEYKVPQYVSDTILTMNIKQYLKI